MNHCKHNTQRWNRGQNEQNEQLAKEKKGRYETQENQNLKGTQAEIQSAVMVNTKIEQQLQQPTMTTNANIHLLATPSTSTTLSRFTFARSKYIHLTTQHTMKHTQQQTNKQPNKRTDLNICRKAGGSISLIRMGARSVASANCEKNMAANTGERDARIICCVCIVMLEKTEGGERHWNGSLTTWETKKKRTITEIMAHAHAYPRYNREIKNNLAHAADKNRNDETKSRTTKKTMEQIQHRSHATSKQTTNAKTNKSISKVQCPIDYGKHKVVKKNILCVHGILRFLSLPYQQ